jgi:hypothetical protein
MSGSRSAIPFPLGLVASLLAVRLLVRKSLMVIRLWLLLRLRPRDEDVLSSPLFLLSALMLLLLLVLLILSLAIVLRLALLLLLCLPLPPLSLALPRLTILTMLVLMMIFLYQVRLRLLLRVGLEKGSSGDWPSAWLSVLYLQEFYHDALLSLPCHPMSPCLWCS